MTWLSCLLRDELDWREIAQNFPFAPAMSACPQDAVYHAEGDVWTHTRMVVEELHGDPEFRRLPDERRRGLTLAAFLHDVGKPATTVVEWDDTEQRERVRQPGHAGLGARMAWQALWREGVERELRQRVYWLVAWHQKTFHMWTQSDMLRQAITFSLVGSWRDLLILGRADNRGRITPNRVESQQTLELLSLWIEEQGVLDTAWPFADRDSMREYLETPTRSPHYATQPTGGSRVIVLCGLPGAGKDTYARTVHPELPAINLDEIRAELKIRPGDPQGAVIQAAFGRAREHLRVKRPFVWNATNVVRSTREKFIRLARDYDAHVAIHVVEKPWETVLRQNDQREAVVPKAVIEKLAAKWEPPSILEAHEVVWVSA